MSLLDITPALGRNPFAVGALLPHTVETKNSTYVIHEHALLVDSEPTVTVVCTKGTFTNQSWVVKAADVALTRAGLRVGGNVGLHTTAPVRVNDLATETWLEALDMDAEDAAYVAKLDAMPSRYSVGDLVEIQYVSAYGNLPAWSKPGYVLGEDNEWFALDQPQHGAVFWVKQENMLDVKVLTRS